MLIKIWVQKCTTSIYSLASKKNCSYSLPATKLGKVPVTVSNFGPVGTVGGNLSKSTEDNQCYDRHRFDSDLYLDPNLHVDADPDPRIQCLGIRDIFVRIRIPESVPLAKRSRSNSGSDYFLYRF
jgi:hypothetical protein